MRENDCNEETGDLEGGVGGNERGEGRQQKDEGGEE